MIELTPAFKEALKTGPVKYQIQVSDDGQAWQDLPGGAEAMLPLGSLTGETEIQPFEFTGSDIEVTANNENGYWSNNAKTGKLDTGIQTRMRIKIAPTSISNEWVQLISGYIDLATVTNYRHEYRVVFIVRGQLNVIDNVLANYVLADMPATYPRRFWGWLTITEVDPAHPEGLFELKYDNSNQKLYWNNGTGYYIDLDKIQLFGQTGNYIKIDKWQLAEADSKQSVSQWIAIKKNSSGVLTAYQTPAAMPIAHLKNKIYNNVNLDISEVSEYPIAGPDPNAINYIPEQLLGSSDFTYLSPTHVMMVDANRWLISFDGGALTGIYLLTTEESPFFKVQSFLRFDPSNLSDNAIMLNGYNSLYTDNYIYLLCEETATRIHPIYNYVTTWKIYKYTTGLVFVGAYAGTGNLLYKSFAGKSDDNFYGLIKTSATKAKINKIVISSGALAYTLKSPEYHPGVSFCPGTIALGQFYAFFTGYSDTTENKVKVYVVLHDTANDTNYPILTEITTPLDPYRSWQFGPVDISAISTIRYKLMVRESLGLFVLLGPINWDGTTARYKLLSDRNELHEVYADNVDSPLVRYSGYVENYTGYISTGQTTYFYCSQISDNIVGMTVEFTSGANVGETRAISAQEQIYRLGLGFITKITMAVALPNIVNGGSPFVGKDGDAFKIYTGAFSLVSARYEYIKHDEQVNIIKQGQDSQVSPASWTTETTGFMANRESVYGFRARDEMFKNNKQGYPVAGDFSKDGSKILIASKDVILVYNINNELSSINNPKQYPEVAYADFDDKTLRDVVEDVARSCNAYLMPSEHNGKLSLIYKGNSPAISFTILVGEYRAGSRYTPYYNYDLVKCNGKSAGIIYAGNKQRSLDVSTQATPEAYSQSLALDILNKMPSGDRLHDIVVNGRLELEPGDFGYLETVDGSTKKVMIMSINTNPTTVEREMLLIEV